MINHDIERLDKTIDRLASRVECVETTHREEHNAIWQLEDKVRRLETEVAHLRGEMQHPERRR